MELYRRQLINLRDDGEPIESAPVQLWSGKYFIFQSTKHQYIKLVDPSVDFIKTTGVSLSDSANEHVTQEDMRDDKRFDTPKIMRRPLTNSIAWQGSHKPKEPGSNPRVRREVEHEDSEGHLSTSTHRRAMDSIGGSKVFSTQETASVFWQTAMDESSIVKTRLQYEVRHLRILGDTFRFLWYTVDFSTYNNPSPGIFPQEEPVYHG
ncbi:unnamed protein product [Umbelopsis sp. WA50703]